MTRRGHPLREETKEELGKEWEVLNGVYSKRVFSVRIGEIDFNDGRVR